VQLGAVHEKRTKRITNCATLSHLDAEALLAAVLASSRLEGFLSDTAATVDDRLLLTPRRLLLLLLLLRTPLFSYNIRHTCSTASHSRHPAAATLSSLASIVRYAQQRNVSNVGRPASDPSPLTQTSSRILTL